LPFSVFELAIHAVGKGMVEDHWRSHHYTKPRKRASNLHHEKITVGLARIAGERLPLHVPKKSFFFLSLGILLHADGEKYP
jgi:hypothetical protein